jgi:hypothetical protein
VGESFFRAPQLCKRNTLHSAFAAVPCARVDVGNGYFPQALHAAMLSNQNCGCGSMLSLPKPSQEPNKPANNTTDKTPTNPHKTTNTKKQQPPQTKNTTKTDNLKQSMLKSAATNLP